MLEGMAQVLAEASPETRLIIQDASRSDYVTRATKQALGEKGLGFSPADDERIDWWKERQDYIVNNSPLSQKQADAAIMIAEFLHESEVRRRGQA